MLLSELSGRYSNASPVEHRLHGLKNGLGVWSSRGVGLQLALHDDIDDFPQFDRHRISGSLNCVDVRTTVFGDRSEF
jgi:hypothetical protein